MGALSIIDVGHGNCAVITADDKVVVVDAGARTHLLKYLIKKNISEVDLVVISHTDQDHVGGLINVLISPNVAVRRVVINSDSLKDSKLWGDVRVALAYRAESGLLVVSSGVYAKNPDMPWMDISDRLKLEVVSPSTLMHLTGPGGVLPKSTKALTSNSSSIVVRVFYDGNPIALLAADMDGIALLEIIKGGVPINASCLIFPHHGGLPGGMTPEDFSKKIIGLVGPHSVIFSNGRGVYDNPRPEIVRAIRDVSPDVYIACTQLSNICSAHTLSRTDYTPANYSAGVENDSFCAGSFDVDLESGAINDSFSTAHKNFTSGLPSSLCLRKVDIILKV